MPVHETRRINPLSFSALAQRGGSPLRGRDALSASVASNSLMSELVSASAASSSGAFAGSNV